ncbi:ribonuclease D [Thiolapillus brandeum]|uniref:Ribonuclease D n=1 Tax=Thiolapillus brandeum TaxID=1076588 RepID=A0A7U6JFX7_9GAMM|nr:ribonuclease D [Thiolapillus brandeum]BAO43146.1 ribonuclease D [Thiolapillus brandeum]
MQESFIETQAQLTDFIHEVGDSPWLAVDTEFIRERTYHPRLCLVQVANDRIATAIDPLALEDLTPLRDLLLDPGIEKVFHAARQDQEIFLNEWGALPSPVFDSQPAAALLGYGDQVGYGKLIQQVLKVELAKDHSRTDWSRRPLDKAQLRYALDDVIYLGQAYQKMKQALEKQGRLEWLKPEFETLTTETTYSLNPMDMWKKVKGRQHLKGAKLAVLQAIAAWREEQALARNLPRRWIIKDDVLLEIARRAPLNAQDLEKIRGVDGKFVRHNAAALTQRIQDALEIPRDQWPKDKFRANRPTPEQEAVLDVLSAALRLVAREAGLSPQAIASRKDLAALLNGEEKSPLRQGWRAQVAGKPLLELLQGKRRIELANGKLSLTRQ